MHKLSGAAAVIVIGVALYFTLFWGYDGLRMLTSPSYGLEDVWRAQFVFAIGSVFGLGPIGLIKLSAFFGAVKLAVACICAFYVVARLRALKGGRADSDILEGGLILVVAISIVSVGPAVLSQNADLVREQTVQLILAAVATGLCLVERRQGWPAATAKATAVVKLAAARGATWFSPFRR